MYIQACLLWGKQSSCVGSKLRLFIHLPKKNKNVAPLQPTGQRGKYFIIMIITWWIACLYIEILHNRYLIYDKIRTDDNTEIIWHTFLCNLLRDVNIVIINRVWSSNYSNKSIGHAFGTRHTFIGLSKLSSLDFNFCIRSEGTERKTVCTLQWRHNGSDNVSNHRRLDCSLKRWLRRSSKKTS